MTKKINTNWFIKYKHENRRIVCQKVFWVKVIERWQTVAGVDKRWSWDFVWENHSHVVPCNLAYQYWMNSFCISVGIQIDNINPCYKRTHRLHWISPYWGRNKMASISQTTLPNAFSWMKMYKFRLTIHWNLSLRVQSKIFHYWFR